MLMRLLVAMASLILCAGCSRSHLQVQVLGEDGEPIRDVTVKAHGGPYFADVRGAFGIYDDEDQTDEDGVAHLKLRIPRECLVTVDLPGYAEWWAMTLKPDLVGSAEFVRVEASQSRKKANMANARTPTIWMRIRD